MPCCGGKRKQLHASPISPLGPEAARVESRDSVLFEYTGRTALTVLGPVTGKRYRFARPGHEVGVDPRDVPAMAGVPNLKRL